MTQESLAANRGPEAPAGFFTLPEAAGLPGMPSSARAVRFRCKRESWDRIGERRPSGKGLMYPVELLPPEAQAALSAKRNISQSPGCAPGQPIDAEAAVWAISTAPGGQVDLMVKELAQRVGRSRATIYRWLKRYRSSEPTPERHPIGSRHYLQERVRFRVLFERHTPLHRMREELSHIPPKTYGRWLSKAKAAREKGLMDPDHFEEREWALWMLANGSTEDEICSALLEIPEQLVRDWIRSI